MQPLCVRFALCKYTCAVRSRFLPTLCAIRATSKRVDRGATTPRPTTPGVARNARLVVSLSCDKHVGNRETTSVHALSESSTASTLPSFIWLPGKTARILPTNILSTSIYHFSTAITWEMNRRTCYICTYLRVYTYYVYNKYNEREFEFDIIYNFKLLNL